LFLVVSAALASNSVAAAAVELAFSPQASNVDPFARVISAEVTTPSGDTLLLPAFYRGDGVFAVRARAAEVGAFRLGAVSEIGASGKPTPIEARSVGPETVAVTEVDLMHNRCWQPLAGRSLHQHGAEAFPLPTMWDPDQLACD
jgi:hypothetical protein